MDYDHTRVSLGARRAVSRRRRYQGQLGVSRNLMVLHMCGDRDRNPARLTCTRRLYSSRVTRWLKPGSRRHVWAMLPQDYPTQPLWPGCAAVAFCPLTHLQ